MSWRVSPNDPKSDHLSIKTYGFHLFPYIYVYMCDFPFQTIHFGTPPLMDPSPPSQASQVALGVKKPRPVRPHRPRSTRRRGSAKCLAFFADGMMGPTWTKNGWFYRLCHRKFAENCEKGDLSTKKYWFKCLNLSIKNKDVTMNAYTVVGLTMINNMFRWNLIMQRI